MIRIPFKTDKQRKAFFANLDSRLSSKYSLRMINDKKRSNVKVIKDFDKDGVPDAKDCEPFNPKKQGFLHDLQVKKLRAQEEKLEKVREKEMKKLEDVKDKLNERQGIADKKANIKQLQLKQKQAIIDEINREKQRSKKLRDANKAVKDQLDRITVSGRIKRGLKSESRLLLQRSRAFAQSPKTKRALKKIGKQLFK